MSKPVPLEVRYRRLSNKFYRLQRIQRGLCMYCATPAQAGKTVCKKHEERRRIHSQRSAARRFGSTCTCGRPRGSLYGRLCRACFIRARVRTVATLASHGAHAWLERKGFRLIDVAARREERVELEDPLHLSTRETEDDYRAAALREGASGEFWMLWDENGHGCR